VLTNLAGIHMAESMVNELKLLANNMDVPDQSLNYDY